jgi:hypothetical protein
MRANSVRRSHHPFVSGAQVCRRFEEAGRQVTTQDSRSAQCTVRRMQHRVLLFVGQRAEHGKDFALLVFIYVHILHFIPFLAVEKWRSEDDSAAAARELGPRRRKADEEGSRSAVAHGERRTGPNHRRTFPFPCSIAIA